MERKLFLRGFFNVGTTFIVGIPQQTWTPLFTSASFVASLSCFIDAFVYISFFHAHAAANTSLGLHTAGALPAGGLQDIKGSEGGRRARRAGEMIWAYMQLLLRS